MRVTTATLREREAPSAGEASWPPCSPAERARRSRVAPTDSRAAERRAAIVVSTASTGAPRACAYRGAARVFEHGAYADEALQAEAVKLDARDRALTMRLAYGAIQRRATLDHVIERLAERPAARLDAPLREALRLGLYELLYLEGTPEYATVAETVELAKQGARAGHGLVNAVLRRAAREGRRSLLGALTDWRPPSRRRSCTPTPSGSRACSGRSSEPSRRAR